MFTYQYNQRKYVYPALAFLLIFLFMLRAMGGEVGRTAPGVRPATAVDAAAQDINHVTNQLNNAAQRLNERVNDRFDGAMPQGDLETRMMRQEHDARRIEDRMFDTRFGDRGNRVNDAAYTQDRRRLDEARATAQRSYREQRRNIEQMMNGSNRNSPEYSRLQTRLNELDRDHAAQERSYEREFRNMDARHSLNRR